MEEQVEYRQDIPVFKNDPILVLVLGIVTCGLYLIYWNIKAAEVLNAVAEKDVISLPVAVISGFCYPVNIYFYYLAGECLEPLGARIGREDLKSQSVLLLVLGIFFPMVAAMILQGHFNKLYEA